MPPSLAPYLVYWYDALSSEDGLWLRCSQPQALMALLYRARALAQDPKLSHLSIQLSRRNPLGELWIVKTLGA